MGQIVNYSPFKYCDKLFKDGFGTVINTYQMKWSVKLHRPYLKNVCAFLKYTFPQSICYMVHLWILCSFHKRVRHSVLFPQSETPSFICIQKVKVDLSLCLTKYNAMTTYGGVEVYFHTFLTSILDGGEWSQLHFPAALSPGKETPVSVRYVAGWAPESICSCRESNPALSARSLVTVFMYLLYILHISSTYMSYRWYSWWNQE